MQCVDVNVLVSALRADAPHHDAAYGWLDRAQRGSETVAILVDVAAAAIRVLTNARIWPNPSRPRDVLAALDDLFVSPAVSLIEPPTGRWATFEALASSMDLSGNDIPDALLAASSMTLDADLVTFDRGFDRFEGLRVARP